MRARVSSKGQLVLPKEIRDRRGLTEGAELEIEEVADGVLLRLVRGARAVTASELLGCTRYHGPPKTLAQMEAAQNACKKYAPEGGGRNLTPAERVAREEAVRRFAKCMREHGVNLHAETRNGGTLIVKTFSR